MNIFKKYIAYLKYNPEGYWFKRKLFGWGWTPARWQGWLTVALVVAFVIWQGVLLQQNLEAESTDIISNSIFIWFYAKIGSAILVLLILCWIKGEKPRWQWGFPKNEE